MQIGEIEWEDSYVKIFHSRIDPLILSGGKVSLCFSKNLVDEDNANTTKK